MLLIGVSFVPYFICAKIFSVGLEHSCDSEPCCCNCLMHFVELSKKKDVKVTHNIIKNAPDDEFLFSVFHRPLFPKIISRVEIQTKVFCFASARSLWSV